MEIWVIIEIMFFFHFLNINTLGHGFEYGFASGLRLIWGFSGRKRRGRMNTESEPTQHEATWRSYPVRRFGYNALSFSSKTAARLQFSERTNRVCWNSVPSGTSALLILCADEKKNNTRVTNATSYMIVDVNTLKIRNVSLIFLIILRVVFAKLVRRPEGPLALMC